MTSPTPSLPPHTISPRLRFRAGLLLFGVVCFLVYNANLRVIGSGDSLPARYLPLILWKDSTLKLDANARLVARGYSMVNPWDRPAGISGKVSYFESWAYWMVRTRQHELASLYPVVTPLLVAPLYYPAAAWLDANGWGEPDVGRVAEMMEKLSAALIATLASVLMYLVLHREDNRWSLVLALAFALGTNTWMISSQALWQHGTGELLIASGLLLVLLPSTPIRHALLGAVCILMAANRPPDLLVASAFALYTVWRHRRNSLWLLAGAAVPLAAMLYYNLAFIGHIAGGYAAGTSPGLKFFELSWSGIAGLLVSPTRGLLVFTPFLIFLPLGFLQRLRDPATRGLAIVLGLAAIAQLLLYSQADWRAGISWGPRWLTDLLPILVWMVAPAPLVLRPLARGLFVLTIAASLIIQAIGAFWYTKASDHRIFAGDPHSMTGAWDIGNVPFLTELRHPPAHPDLLCDAVGFIDFVGSTQNPGAARTPPLLESGARLEGWALAGGQTPSV